MNKQYLINREMTCPGKIRGRKKSITKNKGGGTVKNNVTSVALLVIISIFFFASTAVSSDFKEDSAVKAAESWLALVDNSKYDKSWEEAAAYFRNVIPKEQWQHTIAAVRRPLGDVITRELYSRTSMTSLPGAPDGEYVVIQFKTSFTNKKAAIETITPMLEQDGTWRVSGYYIK